MFRQGERVRVEARGEGETGVISVLKLSVCYVCLHDTCDFSLLF